MSMTKNTLYEILKELMKALKIKICTLNSFKKDICSSISAAINCQLLLSWWWGVRRFLPLSSLEFVTGLSRVGNKKCCGPRTTAVPALSWRQLFTGFPSFSSSYRFPTCSSVMIPEPWGRRQGGGLIYMSLLWLNILVTYSEHFKQQWVSTLTAHCKKEVSLWLTKFGSSTHLWI